MKREQAYRILGVNPGTTEEDLKKRYRELVQLTHPDSGQSCDYPFEIHDIIAAYKFLLESIIEEDVNNSKNEYRIKWNAPTNPNAYRDRPIYQYVEAADGEIIGTIEIDKGKYLWIEDEDFALFLRSLRETAKGIISDFDKKTGLSREDDISLMAEITYLLSGQFFDSETTLSLMKETSEDVYFSKAMLEINSGIRVSVPKEGSYLIPGKIKNHRLFVTDTFGNELGYLSFKDDRLLFGLVPLFERRALQLKLVVSSGKKKANSLDVDMWIKRIPEDDKRGIDSINLRIEKLLEGE